MSPGKYKCARGSDSAPNGYVLWMKKVDDAWVAYDAPEEGGGDDRYLPRFQSTENVLEAGWHRWEFTEWPGSHGNFETVVVL